jgi:hypothetical protein
MKIRVYAHWTDYQPPTPGFAPLPVAPFPASLAGYPLPPGGLPRDAGIPVWSPIPPGPSGLPVVAWSALVKQNDIISANWFGATWPGSPPPAFPLQVAPDEGDEGYSTQAIGFRVTKVTILLLPNVVNNDFEFSITGPAGSNFSQNIPPPWTGSFSIIVPIPFDGKGIWSIEMERTSTPPSSVSAPALLGVPPLTPHNAVNEPYVIPYAGTREGYLGMEFEGDEIICPTGTPSVTIGSCQTDSSGSLVRQVTLTVTFASAPPVGSQLLWTGLPPTIPALDTVTVPQLIFSKLVDYAAGSTQQPTVTLIGTQPTTFCLPSISFGPFSLSGCLPCPTLILEDPMERDSQTNQLKHISGCAGSTARVEFGATINWGAGTQPQPVKYIWTVHTPNGDFEKTTPATSALSITIDTSTGWEKLPKIAGGLQGPVDLTKAGPGYSVAVSGQVQCPAGAPNSCLPVGCNLLATSSFEIPPCNCPIRIANPSNEWQVSGTTAPFGPNSFQSLDCDKTTTTITLNVDRQGLPPSDLSYTWDFGDGSTAGPLRGGPSPTGQNGEQQMHTFTNPTPGQPKTYTIEVTVDTANCPPLKIPMTLEVLGCGQPPETIPPEVTGCSVSAGSPGTIRITFSEDVDQASATNPANFAVTVNSAARVPTSLTYTPNTTTINGININPGQTVNVTVTNVTDKAGNVISGSNTASCSAPPIPPPPSGGFDFCCFLLGIWILAFVIAGVLIYLNFLNAAGWAILAFILAFGAWIIFCCRRNMCVILQWLWIATTWVITIFGVIAIISSAGNPAVAGAYSILAAFLLFLMAISSCGLPPNPFDPKTWPGCRC